MHAVCTRRFAVGLILLLSGIMHPAANASVTLVGSRIIYPGSEKSVDVQLKNKDDFPYVIQTWFDQGDTDTTPDIASSVPFIASPPVFRVQPKSGQVIRVAFTGSQSLPQDRESVFWFNVLQIPPANIDNSSKNKLLVTLRTRVKLFYRPSTLGKPGNLIKDLQIKSVKNAGSGTAIEITNPHPWFVSLSSLQLSLNGATHQLAADMIAPFSSKIFKPKTGRITSSGKAQAQVTLINDQGARVSERYDITL